MSWQNRSQSNVTIAGLGPRRPQSERHQVSSLGGGQSLVHGDVEFGDVADNVI